MKTICVSPTVLMPVMRVRVVWGFGLTEAIFSPIMALSREDFPALVCPASVTKTDFVMRQYPPAGW